MSATLKRKTKTVSDRAARDQETQVERADDAITIKGAEIPVERCWLRQSDLKFYPENPRIYSIVMDDDEPPSQDDIAELLMRHEHVKLLVQSIRANGGLTDPLLVRGGDYVVLEGNSRLAAYRILAQKDPVTWGMVKCLVLPSNIGDDQVFAILGEYHIIGRQDWLPFEQAGYLYRRSILHNNSWKAVGEDIGLSESEVRRLAEIYGFMLKHNDACSDKWSYYEEYLTIRAISKARKEHPELDVAIVNKIKTGEISKAIDIRQKVAPIAKVGGKVLSSFINTPRSLNECFEKAEAGGQTQAFIQKLRRFRQHIVEQDIRELVADMSVDQMDACEFEIKRILSSCQSILTRIEEKTTRGKKRRS